MNQLHQHIRYLIGRHDCVIVPGFGAFIVERIPSRIDSETLAVYPSETRIGFNSELIDDDGLLIHSIARKGRMSHPDARRVVEHSVQSLKERLNESEAVEFSGIGSFRLTEDGRKIFSPLLPEEPHVCFLPLLAKNAGDLHEKDVDEVMTEEFESFDEKLDSADTSADDSAECTRAPLTPVVRVQELPMRIFVSRVACALVIVIAALLAFVLPGTEGAYMPVQKASIVPVESLLNIKQKADSVAKVAVKAEKPAKTAEESVSPKRNETLRFHLIVGTFSSREEAEKFIAANEDSVADLTPIEGRSGMWRVSAASSDERSELQASLNGLNGRFPGVWIWEKQ